MDEVGKEDQNQVPRPSVSRRTCRSPGRFDSGEQFTTVQLLAAVRSNAAGLQALGVRQGDHVLSWLPNGSAAVLNWLALNLLGSGVFLLFGVIARRGAAAGLGGDPVPQALVITGIVVAFSATAIAIALLSQLQSKAGRTSLEDEAADDEDRS